MINSRSPSFFKVLIGDFATKLRIPTAFLKNFNGFLPKICILKSISDKTWQVTMDKNDEGYFFNRGWSKFVKYHGLEYGDFLLFWFRDNSKFEVVIYGRTACEKDIDFKCEGRPTKKRRNPSCARQTHNSHDKIKREVKEEMCAGVDCILPTLPSFVKILQDYQRFDIAIPKVFARVTGLTDKRRIVVKDSQGNVWPVHLRNVKGAQLYLSTGWSKYWAAKGLAAGDKCLFQYIQGSGNVLSVQILSKGAGR
ncbi:B3 domain-containing protein [Cephalotus follicularis]|uniref:B3 domain-containing protein n=1 Tax=Cephalotus follicularis TaxID=3775 RepID=A0A1Q3D9I8_CEPFO|nr:B3 domain-containing protein [Cephalotus follicularis]